MAVGNEWKLLPYMASFEACSGKAERSRSVAAERAGRRRLFTAERFDSQHSFAAGRNGRNRESCAAAKEQADNRVVVVLNECKYR